MVLGVFSRGMARIPHLEKLLGQPVLSSAAGRFSQPVDAIAGWGYKPTSIRARRYAEKHAIPYLAVEDGFLRSVGLGGDEPPLSLVKDGLGIYYDASRPSHLEVLIATSRNGNEISRANALIAAWRSARISKYNHLREHAGELPARYVLLADQTLGDASVTCGLADAQSFQRMLEAALKENPECIVLVKVHPDVFAGKKRGYFDIARISKMQRVQVLGEDVHPVSLIERAEGIYVVTSQLGFEGLLWGKRVRTFGMPFYAGWGLTRDDLPAPARRGPVLLESLVHAALIDYPRYIDPETHDLCEAEHVIEWMGLQRNMRGRYPATVHALGFSVYKRPIVRSFFQGSRVKFAKRADAIPSGATLAVWGRQEVKEPGMQILRLEDGFIRSVGLGADLVRPLSWVMDGRGIYYDATQPSDLERILHETRFDDALRIRATVLQKRMVSDGLTKYNVGMTGWQRPAGRERVILVPGQVESDASLAYGAPGIRRNLELLRAVREANPGAYVVYKPHPDVVAGLRRMGDGECSATQWCDEVLMDASMGELLLAVDEVHTLTSLAGFEALLRGRKVVCYGQPFYAGWGLTLDVLPVERRQRKLSLEELIAGVLILYPAYVSVSTGHFTTPERALDELLEWRRRAPATPWWNGIYRFLVKWILRKT